MKVAAFVAATVVVFIVRLVAVMAAFWVGATVASTTLPFEDLAGAAVALVGAHWAVSFTIELNISHDRPRW